MELSREFDDAFPASSLYEEMEPIDNVRGLRQVTVLPRGNSTTGPNQVRFSIEFNIRCATKKCSYKERVVKASVSDQRSILDIQNFDFTTTSLNAKAAGLPEIPAINTLAIKQDNARDLRIAAETELNDVKRELNRAETDVEQVVSRINRDEARLASGTGAAKELEQLQHELVSLAARRAELEEVELEIMMRVDGIKERIAELSAEESAHAAEIANLEISKENALTIIFADLKAAAVRAITGMVSPWFFLISANAVGPSMTGMPISVITTAILLRCRA